MSQLFNYSGDDDFFLGGSKYSNHADVFFPCKRARFSASVVPFEDGFEQKKQTSIDTLPDECLFEILRRVPGGQERGACTIVSKRWLMCLSSIKSNEVRKAESDSEEAVKEDGLLTRSLEGKKATDVRLAAIAVGTSSRGGLGRLMIKGNNPTRGVTCLGLRAVSRCCPSLKSLSLWEVLTIGDDGLIEISKGCIELEKLHLFQCPNITDKALVAIAKGCPNLASIIIDSCQNVGNEGLQAIGKYCTKLKSVSIKDCPLVRDQGVSGLLSYSKVVTTVKLNGLTISDISLAVIGHYCLQVTDLVLSGLQHVTERGFWCMGNGQGLQKLKNLTITSCRVTDQGLESIGRGCPNMKTFCLRKCAFLSDNGLISFVRAAASLESVELDMCHRVTQVGFFGLILNCGNKLKAISVSSCFGIKDMPVGVALRGSARSTLQSLTIHNCPLFGDVNLVLLSTVCTELRSLELSGLSGISDHGVTPLIENSDAGLVNVNLRGCVNLTDETASTLIRTNGATLENLNLGGCGKITDATLLAVAEHCLLLNELDVSRSAISDMGISAVSRSNQLISLQVLCLSGCTLLSDKCLYSIAKLELSLVGLNLRNCNGISSRGVDMLEARMWNCDILS